MSDVDLARQGHHKVALGHAQDLMVETTCSQHLGSKRRCCGPFVRAGGQ
jgi:hypothetical protein